MKKIVIKIAFTLIALATITPLFSKIDIIPAKGIFQSRFAIIIDKPTYNAAKQEVLEYQKCLIKEGLGAFIMVGDWKTPDELKTDLKGQYTLKPVLEGVVFIGNIPVARLQNAQHMTSAFKMDELKFPIDESSVTSDRFYDDLHMEFEFIKQDEKNPLHFYYKLKSSSTQAINSQFYSARMMPPTTMGKDPIALLKSYLKKVVKAHSEMNPADQLVIFNGSGYNSDCLTAWNNEQFAIKEQFPLAFKTSKGNGFYNYRQDPYMKFKLYDKMQQKGTDLFIFHEHGAFDTQYINAEYPAVNSLEDVDVYTALKDPTKKIGYMSAFSISMRNLYRKAKGEKAAAFKAEALKEYGLTESFFDVKLLDSLKASDAAFSKEVNIYLNDIAKLKPQSKFTIFDACYNGSYNKPGYVAGYHIFGDGNTIVTQGNTVNVLQDKWTIELIGMLSQGARVGFWQKEIQFLESHLVGDPTYRFYDKDADKLNKDLAINSNNQKVWNVYLKSENPNLQAIALKKLASNPPANYSNMLIKFFKESPYYSVRMEALKRLLEMRDKNMVDALIIALDDPYEMIRRNAARYAGYCGDPSLIAPLVNIFLFSHESQRVQYAAQNALTVFDQDGVKNEIEKQIAESNLINKSKSLQNALAFVSANRKDKEGSLKVILDNSANMEKRVSSIRGLRNNNNHMQAEMLIQLLKDTNQDSFLRQTLAEAFGWFNLSIKRTLIIDALNEVMKDPKSSVELKNECQQSITRLN